MISRSSWAALVCAAALGMTSGCADRPKDVPTAAEMRGEGSGRLVFVADRDGTMWISDQGDNTILYSGRVHGGDRVVLDPDKDQLTVNDRVVLNTRVHNARHRVFFEQGDMIGNAGGADVQVHRPADVPVAAGLRGEGRGRVTYTASEAGMVYVADSDADRVIYAGRVSRGDAIVCDPSTSQVTVNGKQVAIQGTANGREHRIFFQPGDMSAGGVPARDVTVVRPAEVPAAATLRAESTDAIDVRPDTDGTVWVAASDTGRVVYSGRMLQGDRLMVDPQGSQITLNGRSVYDRPLPRDRYRVYFLSGAR